MKGGSECNTPAGFSAQTRQKSGGGDFDKYGGLPLRQEKSVRFHDVSVLWNKGH